LGSHQAAFTTLAFDCNPTHFVTPRGHPVTHNAFAPRRLCPIVVRHIWPSGGGDTASGARLPPPFELTPRRDFPSARCSPARALFFVCAIRAPARLLPAFPQRPGYDRCVYRLPARRNTLLQRQVDPSAPAALNGDIHAAQAAIKNEGSSCPMFPAVPLSPQVYGCRMCCAQWALPPYCLFAVRRPRWPPIRPHGWRGCRTFPAR